jgi:MoaA/NifB/PqqE/SkfB family radical SAM enzyme
MTGRASASVRFLQVEPTTRCNFRCGFCAGRQMDQTDLEPGAFARVLDGLPELEHLELQGEGEPLMHPAFFEMARLARARGIEVSTISNGSLFSPARIEKLLDADLTSVLVSIESPDPSEFAAIRGGRLDKVIQGIGALLSARAARRLRRPAVGFAVTVLRSTEGRFPELLELYRRLGLDGGVIVQTLNPMQAYARSYSENLRAETYSRLGSALAVRRLLRLAEQADLDRRGEPTSFWTKLFARETPPGTGCPWLRSALYIDRRGRVTTCPYVKDGDLHGLGRIEEVGLDGILAARRETERALEDGVIPTPCQGCAIADAVAHPLHPREARA